MAMIYLTIFACIISWQRGFSSNGLLCYECRSTSASNECILDVGEASECNKNYCTIYRQEYLDPPGELQHFYRSCESQPTYLNAVIQTANHKSYYRACSEDRCNVGDGRTPPKQLEFKNATTATIYVVPGTGSASKKVFLVNQLIPFLIGLTLLLR